MVKITEINTEAEYEIALARAYKLFNSEPGTPEGEEADELVDLIVAYEEKHYIPDSWKNC